eukprot:GGOE01048306.1.p1 GENE.GGOE01048306.1~~GGOE01048306.1.p1  ORF type:complete len:774 (+),score=204.46 GGOE01048306.1:282-2324(+)
MDAYAEAVPLARMMWPVLESNSKLLLIALLTVNGSSVKVVGVDNFPSSGPCITFQNGTHHWIEHWDAEHGNPTGQVVGMLPAVTVDQSVNGNPFNETTSDQPFFWIPVNNPQINLGNVFSANVGLFDGQGRYMGRYGIAISTAHLSRFLSEQLAAQPATRSGRIALYDELGLVVAASHGNPDQNVRLGLSEIGDADLEAAGRLIGTLTGWCPNVSLDDVHFSRRYFMDTNVFADPITKPRSLRWCAVLLSPRENTMQCVDQSVSFAVAFVCGTTIGVTVLAIALGLLVTRPIKHLTAGMGALKACRFAEARRATGWKSFFTELVVAQGSYDSLVEAIDAFGKYVPNTVVRGLLAGTIRTPAEEIVSVMCQLFDTCCDVILRSEGTVDKFIGDCIMAMWNAPLPRPNHERSAVTAALRMQRAVLSLHDSWRQCGLPILKFRLGIHTGHCLVGNFGCSYRVSYTCLGNSVNLASRLEALNKKFDTTVCMSQSTHDGCKNDFHFRHLSKVTVPGCSEVLSVYEVLCAVDAEEEQDVLVRSFRGSLCSATDVSPILAKPMVNDMRLESVDSPRAKGKTPSTSDLLGEEAESAMLCIAQSSSFIAPDREKGMAYHWDWHDRQAILKEAAEYEAAYTALVEGRYAQCRGLVTRRQPDKSWQALAAQLEQQVGSSQLWDGVFYFREK